MVANHKRIFDMKRAVDKMLIAFAVHAAAHVPSSVALDFASAERDVV